MASVQRRRGEVAEFYAVVEVVDKRGDRVVVAEDVPRYVERVACYPERSSRAEVPGQQQINAVVLIVKSDLVGVNVFSRVFFRGVWWDVVQPPAKRNGYRVRHWSVLIRERPDSDGGNRASSGSEVVNG